MNCDILTPLVLAYFYVIVGCKYRNGVKPRGDEVIALILQVDATVIQSCKCMTTWNQVILI